MQAMDTRKVAASRAKAAEAPTAATRMPPNAGPAMRRARGRTNWSRALAWSSSSAGTRSGTTASKAGPKKPVAAPYTAAQASSGQSGVAAAERRGGQPEQGGAAHQVAGEQHAAARQSVGDQSADQQQRELRRGEGDADGRHRRRRARDVVDVPGEGDEQDAVAEQRDAHAGPQQGEVPVTQDPRRPQPRGARGHRGTSDGRAQQFTLGEQGQRGVEFVDLRVGVGGGDLDAEADGGCGAPGGRRRG